jgi:hypothetical protein
MTFISTPSAAVRALSGSASRSWQLECCRSSAHILEMKSNMMSRRRNLGRGQNSDLDFILHGICAPAVRPAHQMVFAMVVKSMGGVLTRSAERATAGRRRSSDASARDRGPRALWVLQLMRQRRYARMRWAAIPPRWRSVLRGDVQRLRAPTRWGRDACNTESHET